MVVAPVRIATPLRYNIRQVATTPPKKAQVANKAAKTAERTARPSAATAKPKKASNKAAAASEKSLPVVEATKVGKPVIQTEFSATPTTTDGANPRIDPSSPEYKEAARKWVSTMIALPILIVTTYFLFDRLVAGNNPSLERFRSKPRTVPAAKEA
ncbi:hypothetical protein VMCG_04927 [Cytospora schulzeri]|uniref:Uncharacterized protein n=1 Tax=Cytospora schulzeri TaxID=448051 RepID=A0A423WMZ9_9PEZI|nr:hypothetical protein VMCG_04927 [Valsa malicola]